MDLEGLQPLWYEKGVSMEAHVLLARRAAKDFAKRLGFSEKRVADVSLCVTELAQNHLDHKTVQGLIRLFGQRTGEKEAVLVMSSLDMGPGMKIKKRQDAGFLGRRGLGAGLDSVKRLADGFGLCSGKLGDFPCPDLLLGSREFETLIAASFVEPRERFMDIPMDFSFLIRPAGESSLCGDGFSFSFDYPFFQMVVMDALGKGGEAAQILAAAKRFLALVPPSTHPQDLLLALGKEIVGSRGIMAQAVRVNVEDPEILIGAAGDVEHILFINGKERFVSGRSGPVGPVNTKRVIEMTEITAFSEVMGIFYTDGLGRVPKLRFNQALMEIPAIIWTNYLFSLCGQEEMGQDDATLVVWKWKT